MIKDDVAEILHQLIRSMVVFRLWVLIYDLIVLCTIK